MSPEATEFWTEVRRSPSRQAQVVALHYVEDRSVEDVADLLGITAGSVKTHLHRARESLAKHFRRGRRRHLGEPAQRNANLIAEAQTTVDCDRLRSLLIEAESILTDNAVVYPLTLRQALLIPYWPDRIQGLAPHQGWDTATAAWWWSPQG